jgi:hypothetical protein
MPFIVEDGLDDPFPPPSPSATLGVLTSASISITYSIQATGTLEVAFFFIASFINLLLDMV